MQIIILKVDFFKSVLGSIDIINDYAIFELIKSKIHLQLYKITVFACYVRYFQQFIYKPC